MTGVELELPRHFIFSTELVLRASEINDAGHLGNDALLSLLQDARIRFFEEHDLNEGDIDGVGIIIADALLVYASEAFRGKRLQVEIALLDFNKYGCDIVCRATSAECGRVALHLILIQKLCRSVFTDRCDRCTSPQQPA
jgi:acyl-CoA thioester hydrolase